MARTGQRPVASSGYIWHQDPDGGATFATDDGGWVYVSNAEVGERGHGGDVLVAEDGAEMRIVVVGPDVTPFELVNVLGHRGSEICGPAFSPGGSRLYFSSQNGAAGTALNGRIHEMQGPFFV